MQLPYGLFRYDMEPSVLGMVDSECLPPPWRATVARFTGWLSGCISLVLFAASAMTALGQARDPFGVADWTCRDADQFESCYNEMLSRSPMQVAAPMGLAGAFFLAIGLGFLAITSGRRGRRSQ